MTTISDYFGEYPNVNDPLFNTKISRMVEFSELRPPAGPEPTPPSGEGFKHQKFGVRYLTWYDRLALFHEPGTGKSCIIVHSAELFKREHLKDPDDPTKINRAVILINRPSLKENIRNEIICKCTNHIYETERVKDAGTEELVKRRLNDELKKWYDIMKFSTFVNKIRSFDREEKLIEYMSNKVFYIDEAHNLPTLHDIQNIGKPSPLTVLEARQFHQAEEARYQERLKQLQKEGKAPKSAPRWLGETNYQTFWRAFHQGHRNKIVIATATPMKNSARDIIPLMNLILPLNQQMPPWTEQELAELTLEQVEPYFRARVSYIRASDTGARPDFQGVIPENSMTHIYPVPMSSFQFAAYLRSNQNNPETNPAIPVTQGALGSFYIHQRQASNFVFPDGTYGKDGFSKYIEEKPGGQYVFRDNADGRQLREMVSDLDSLNVLSAKYAEIVTLCLDSYPEANVEVRDDQGIIFIYFADFVKGSGAISLGLCLQENGYEEFRTTRNIFTSTRTTNRLLPCASKSEDYTERSTNLPKRPRYAMLTGETSPAQISALFNALNSYENRYGEYIQVLIASETAKEGINVNNAVKQIMASGGWNYSSNYQAQERVFRSTSHEIRLQEIRERMAEQGENPDEASMAVEVYNMASIYEGDPNATEEVLRRDFTNTIDAQQYLIAEQKDRGIRRMARYYKQSSIDCYLNYNRNVRDTDVDGTPECDYTECGYECAGIDPTLLHVDPESGLVLDVELDWTTKILYYSDEEVSEAIQKIKTLFSRFYSLRIEQIYNSIPDLRPVFIDKALEKLIRENIRMLDRMGFYGYLREGSNEVIYLEKDPFESRSHPENTAYTSVLIGTQDPRTNTFSDYETNIQAISELPLIEELRNIQPGTPEFINALESLSTISKVNLYEYVIHRRLINEQTSDFDNAIVRFFDFASFRVIEPVSLLERAARDLANKGKGRGRKPNPNAQPKIRKIALGDEFPLPEFDPTQEQEMVYIHTLLNQGDNDLTQYGAVSKHQKAEGQLRLLKPSEQIGWRNMNDYEYMVYNSIIQQNINQVRSYYERFDIYGIMIPPEDRVRIRDRENEDPQKAAADPRKQKRGKVCNSWSKSDIIDIMYRLGIDRGTAIPENVTRDQIIHYLAGKNIDSSQSSLFDNDKLAYFYSWYLVNYSRDDLCGIIKEYFQRTGRLYQGKIPQGQAQETPNVGSILTGGNLTYPEYVPATEEVSLPSISGFPPP